MDRIYDVIRKKTISSPLCYSEKDVKVTVANQACNSLMCNFTLKVSQLVNHIAIRDKHVVKSSQCSLGTEWKFWLKLLGRKRIAILCLVYSLTYPRVHPLRTLASAGITVQSPSRWGWSKVLVNGVVLSWRSVIGFHTNRLKLDCPYTEEVPPNWNEKADINFKGWFTYLKGVFAKNERGYRLNAIKKRFWSLLILLLSVGSIRRKLLKTSHTE